MEWRCIYSVIDSEAFQKSKGGNKLQLLCSTKAKISQAYCVLRTNSKPWAAGTHGITTKYWSKGTKRPGIRMSDFMKPILKYSQTQTVHIVHAGMFSVKNQPFIIPSLSLPLKPTKITAVLFFMRFSPVLYLCLHLKYTILCWYLGQPHWEGESHYCLSLFLKWMNLYSQLYSFGFKGWYFHDKLLPPTCQSTVSLSSQPAQRQGDDIPQDIWEPRVLPHHHHHHCCCCLWMEMKQGRVFIIYWFYPKGYTMHHQICFAGWETSKLRKLQNLQNWKKVFPFLCLSSGWSLKQANTSSVSKPRTGAVEVCLSHLCYSSVMKQHQLGGTLLPYTTKTVNTEGIKWKRNSGAHKSRVTELLNDLKPQHELTLAKCLSLT